MGVGECMKRTQHLLYYYSMQCEKYGALEHYSRTIYCTMHHNIMLCPRPFYAPKRVTATQVTVLPTGLLSLQCLPPPLMPATTAC